MKTPQPINKSVDKSILVLLAGIMLVALTVFSFKAITHKPCEIVNFDIQAKHYRVGEIIRFKDFSEQAERLEWDFGDDSEYRHDANPFHTYEAPGTYDITLTVNGSCDYTKTVVIAEKRFVIDSSRIAAFEIPSTIKVGELLSAKDLTKNATSWEWRFGETAAVNSTYQNPTYAYKTPGLKTVTLIVNGDPRYSTQKKINVLRNGGMALPPPKPKTYKKKKSKGLPVKPGGVGTGSVVPNPNEQANIEKTIISRKAFAEMLIKVSDEEANAGDFDPYVCGNLEIPVYTKGKQLTFVEFCSKIQGKNIKIKALEILRNKKTNCIEYISIDYSKSLF